MRSLTLWTQVSLDGYTSAPDGTFDWTTVGPETQAYFQDRLREKDTYLYGRRVYEGMAAFWPAAAENPALPEFHRQTAQTWLATPKIVFSRTMTEGRWNTRIVGGDIPAEATRLKQEPGGGLVLFGGATITAEFLRLGLVDDYRLFVHPVTLGGGQPLFPAGLDRTRLRLLESRTLDDAVVHLRYQPSQDTPEE